jgi:beta-lactamase regulating signal transducer with metallopeptidase domain
MLLEPDVSGETIGWLCLAMAALCLVAWGISIGRTVRIANRSARYVDRCRKTSQEAHVEAAAVWVIDAQAPLMALSGILKPRLLMSRNVVGSLSAEELSVAVRHESAHRESLDNLKRLIMMITPGILPFANGFGTLERGWSRFTEWAADDRAVSGDADSSVALASALVRVSRLGVAAKSSLLATSLIGDRSDLQSRVDRLLSATTHPTSRRWPAVVMACGAVAITGSLLRVLMDPATLSSVHGLLEYWMQ